jgi:hypothetical protein
MERRHSRRAEFVGQACAAIKNNKKGTTKMGAALYIVLERQIPGFDTSIDGKMLSKAEGPLAQLAKRLDVRPLMEFFSMNPEDAGGVLGAEELGDVDIPAEQWFLADEGLATIQALLGGIEGSPELEKVKEDLFGLERVLKVAQTNRVRWHLAVDF